MKIFVTGGAGFIGRHLIQSLSSKNHQITVFDNLTNSSEDKILHLLDDSIHFVKGDITNYEDVSKTLSGFNVVIHLAARISVQDSLLHPKETTRINVDGTINLLRSCVQNNVKNFIAASSAAVYGYGKHSDLPINDNSKTESLSPYAESKLVMEKYIKTFVIKHDINAITLRFFNVYGKGQSVEYAGVITKFMEKISKNEPLEIFGDGLQTRDFVAVQDIIESIHNGISRLEGKRGSIFNIGSGKRITIKSLADLMISLSGKKLDIKNSEPQKGDVKYSWADISHAKKELDYNPKIGIKEGIKNLMMSSK